MISRIFSNYESTNLVVAEFVELSDVFDKRFLKKRKPITLSLSSTWSGYVPKMNRMISSWFAMIDLCSGEWP